MARKKSQQNPDELRPQMVRLADLERVLWPYIGMYRWARDELRDLWLMGAPDPHQIVLPGREKEERRLLLPSQFEAWWKNVARRHQLEEMRAAYALRGLRELR